MACCEEFLGFPDFDDEKRIACGQNCDNQIYGDSMRGILTKIEFKFPIHVLMRWVRSYMEDAIQALRYGVGLLVRKVGFEQSEFEQEQSNKD